MNYPLGSCYNHFLEVANLLEDLQWYSNLKYCPQHQLNHLSPSSDDETDTTQPAQEPMNVDPPFIESSGRTSLDSGPFVEKYEGAAEEYGAGVTFMSEFHHDQYAVEHLENIYYPFTSRNE